MRCRNCGLMHKTQHCPSFGPAYPAPGKTFADYLDEYERIQNLVAGDVLKEHYNHDHGSVEEEDTLSPYAGNKKGGKRAPKKKVPSPEGATSEEVQSLA